MVLETDTIISNSLECFANLCGVMSVYSNNVSYCVEFN